MGANASARIARVLAALLLAFCACRERSTQRSYVASLRCGMTPAEVTKLAHENGYNGSDRNWLARTTSNRPSKDLRFVDLTFRAGRLVAYREAVYDPRTKKTAYRTVALCGGGR